MQQIISQVLLPIVLAAIMFGMGLNLKPRDFGHIFVRPKAAALGLALQLVALPILAIAIIFVFNLPTEIAAGLFLLSLCPGGATSNLFSYLAKGDIALSVSLTAVSSLIVPFSLPLLFLAYSNVNEISNAHFELPLLLTIKQLVAVTLVPVIFGMTIRYFFEPFSQVFQVHWNRLATFAMISVVIALIVTNPQIADALISIQSISVISLCLMALTMGYVFSLKAKLSETERRTIAIEVGVQNAGTAMMVALTILQQPTLAFIPLMYGILMNIPAFAFIAWARLNTSTDSAIATKS